MNKNKISTLLTGQKKCLFALVLFLSLILLSGHLSAQTNRCFKGKVIEKQTNEPISFAAIGIRKAGIGVNSNETGDFSFNFSSENIADTIDISCLGYEKVRVSAKSIQSDVFQIIELSPNAVSIKDVTIKIKAIQPKAKDLVKKAIAHIADNYPVTPFALTGYYRDYLKEKETYYNLVEAAIIVEDYGFHVNDFKTTAFRMLQFRMNKNYELDYAKNSSYYKNTKSSKKIPFASMPVQSDNELTILRIHDPIRNHNCFSFSLIDILDKDFSDSHRFKLNKFAYIDSVPIYTIEINGEKRFKDEGNDDVLIWGTGFIFINSRTYAIEKLSYKLSIDSKEFVGKILEVNLEYKEFNSKMYLNYLSVSNYFEMIKDGELTKSLFGGAISSPDVKLNLYQYREFFVNKISPMPYKRTVASEKISKNKTLLLNSLTKDSTFWNTFNYTQKPLLN